MNTGNLLSIIVPVYNTEKYLVKCIDSIIRQTYNNLEIILVDDGSTDNSGKICDHYHDLDDRIIVIHKENGGQATARNAGIEISKGEYIGFVDSDDWIEPQMYEMLLNAIKDHEVAICGRYNVNELTGNKSIAFCAENPFVLYQDQMIKCFLQTNMVDGSPCDKLFRRALIENLRFPVGYICEDLPFVYSYLLKCSSMCHLGIPYYNYVQRTGGTSKSKFSEKTYGLVIYSKQIMNDAIERFPSEIKDANVFYNTRLYHFFRIYFESNAKNETSISFRLSDFQCLPIKDRIICFLMKIHLYKFVYNMYKRLRL